MEVSVQIIENCGRTCSIYKHVPIAAHDGVHLQATDPCFLNLNSHDRVMEVLRHIGKFAGISQYVPIN